MKNITVFTVAKAEKVQVDIVTFFVFAADSDTMLYTGAGANTSDQSDGSGSDHRVLALYLTSTYVI